MIGDLVTWGLIALVIFPVLGLIACAFAGFNADVPTPAPKPARHLSVVPDKESHP